MTTGQLLVGLRFNPSSLTSVDECKQRFADQIDMLEALPNPDGSVKGFLRQEIIARAELLCLEAQMMCVKALTFEV